MTLDESGTVEGVWVICAVLSAAIEDIRIVDRLARFGTETVVVVSFCYLKRVKRGLEGVPNAKQGSQ